MVFWALSTDNPANLVMNKILLSLSINWFLVQLSISNIEEVIDVYFCTIFLPPCTNCKNWKFLSVKKGQKKKMLRQSDFYGLLICNSMTFKLSMGKNSAWYFLIPRSNLFLPVYIYWNALHSCYILLVKNMNSVNTSSELSKPRFLLWYHIFSGRTFWVSLEKQLDSMVFFDG